MSFRIKTLYANLMVRTLQLPNSVVLLSGVGAPTNGVTGANVAGPGSLYADATATTSKLYINTNTKASPTWVSVGSQT